MQAGFFCFSHQKCLYKFSIGTVLGQLMTLKAKYEWALVLK
jgi:hypothetical protein